MNAKEKAQNNITNILKSAIASPASRVGRRLKSESELGELLGVGRWSVRKSIDELEKEGLLTRRHGSGTYVQKIPHLGTDLSLADTGEEMLPPESLFTKPSRDSMYPDMLRSVEVCKRYTIGLWSDLHCTSSLNQRILADMVRSISEAGHTLTIHSVVEERDTPYSIDKLTNLLRENPCDGYLCFDRWTEVFLRSLGLQTKPVLFFAMANSTYLDKPVVMIDTNTALRKGIKILAEEGYSRIAMIGLRNPGRLDMPDTETAIYEQAMIKAGLDYRCIKWVETTDVSEVISATKEMFASNDLPDAIYVSDDYIMDGLAEALKIIGIKPGADLGLITLGSSAHDLSNGYEWSRMETDFSDYVGLIVDRIIRSIEGKKTPCSSVSLIPRWIPGETHFK
jgi:DNA-binding LacI/PurR family transcriptional regulator/DNA-binding transcriptional regulator YhcF (GntR family)